MASPDKLDFADWFSIIATAMISGIGAAMAWFSSSKREMQKRMTAVEGTMQEHATNLAVLKTCQENTESRLNEISETTRDTNQNLKELSQTMTQVLLSMKSKD